MPVPHPEQFRRHDAFLHEHRADLVSTALAGYEVYGRGAVIVDEPEQTMRYQGGGGGSFAGKRWRKESAWVRLYDPETMAVIIFNTPEGNHASYLMRMPWTAPEIREQLATMELTDEASRLMNRLLRTS